MNLKKRTSRRVFKNNQAWLFLLASPLAASRVMGAQGILYNPAPAPNVTPPAMQADVVNNPMNVFVPAGVVNGDEEQPFQYGPLALHPHVDYNISYGDGITVSPTNHQNTAIQEISPGIYMELGRHWSLDYTPTIRFYSSNQFRDGVDHSLSLTGGTHYEDWTFGLTQSFLYSTAPTAETGAQTGEQNFNTGLTASRILNEKFSMDLDLNQTLAFADSLQNSRTWNTMDWLNYILTPRLNVGAGLGFTYENVDIGPDQTSEQLQARINWRATDKLSFQLSGGLEDLQYSDSPQPDTLTPTFSGSIQYLPFQDTQVSVSASRQISPSVIPGSDSTVTSFGLNLNQALFRKFSLNLGVGYSISKYTEIQGIKILNFYIPYSQNRTDNDYNFSARLSHPFYRHGTWSVFYSYSDNQSSDKGFSFESNQVGFDFSYRF